MRRKKLRAAVDAATKAAGEAEAEKAACGDPEKPFLCPDVDVVVAAKRNTCQKSKRACGDARKKNTCEAEGKRWCGTSCLRILTRAADLLRASWGHACMCAALAAQARKRRRVRYGHARTKMKQENTPVDRRGWAVARRE